MQQGKIKIVSGHILLSFLVLLYAGSCKGSQNNEPVQQGKQVVTQKEHGTPNKIVVYYFHTSYRCQTCNLFQKLTQEVLDTRFKGYDKDDKIIFKVINIEEKANEHFVTHYKLVTKSLVLSLKEDDNEIEWKNLDQIWVRIRDTEGFKNYIDLALKDYTQKLE